ncbi:MAG: competence protein [Bacteroidetes bacterium]|nr:competence protein [Bacteroidota bacterium]
MSDRRTLIQGLVRPLRDFLFPPLCFACERLLGEEEEIVCAPCLAAIRSVSEADSHYQDTLDSLASEGTISGLVAAYYFEAGGPLQTLVHQLKYSGMTSVGSFLGERLGEKVKRELVGLHISCVVPVPLHLSKRRERGYNQSEYICRGMSSVLAAPVMPKMVVRKVYTQTQTMLNSEERKHNVAGAFALRGRRPPMMKNATVLLVDDVVTTGSTMRSCARVLMEGGAKQVIACAVALAM